MTFDSEDDFTQAMSTPVTNHVNNRPFQDNPDPDNQVS